MLTHDEERFAANQGPETRDGCIPWLGGVQDNGYGFFSVDGVKVYAHRFAYERAHGAVPRGYDVHHRCGVKRCVRIDHLEAMPASEHRREAKLAALAGLT